MEDKEIEQLSKLMEELANTPKEEMGKRLPGEKGTYEKRSHLAAPMVGKYPRLMGNV